VILRITTVIQQADATDDGRAVASAIVVSLGAEIASASVA
jgi:hypothetical protein